MHKKINLRLFADLGSILESHQDAFADNPDVGTQFSNISTKLAGLGYDVLINQREAAEFVPSSRLSEVVAQRDSFKSQTENLAKQLEKMKGTEGVTPEVQAQINELAKANEALLQQLESSQINMEIIAFASDAHNSKDVAAFVNMEKVTIDKQGKVHGIKEEIERIKAEKPYMFKDPNDKLTGGSKGGNDTSGGSAGGANGGSFNMNQAIRRAAGVV